MSTSLVNPHPALRQVHITPIKEPLYVVCAIENPEGYASRYRNYHTFAKAVADGGAILYTVEVVSGQRQFEVTDPANPHHIQLRAKTDLWRKENLGNIGAAWLPHDWRYMALCDGDFLNTRGDWVQATLQALQRYDAVQMFSTYSCLKADHSIESVNNGFVYAYQKGITRGEGYGPSGAPGGEWAYTRATWEAIRGMLQTPILGSADWYMAYAMVGSKDKLREEELSKCSPAYIADIENWCARARKVTNANVGYVDNHAIHYWHGSVNQRGYGWRWKILATYQFDPAKDLVAEHSGLLELAGNKPAMQKEIRDYFRSRNEDATS